MLETFPFSILNHTLIWECFAEYIIEFCGVFSGDIWKTNNTIDAHEPILIIPENTGETNNFYLSFNEFQYKILKYLSAAIIFNILCIIFTWKIYGGRISSRFLKTGKVKQEYLGR